MLYVNPAPVGEVIEIAPVDTVQVGCVRLAEAADGGVGCALITTLDELADVQPLLLVTENVYVLFAASPLNVPIEPVPVNVELFVPSLAVTVQLPLDGNPLNATLAVETSQVGCVTVPMMGTEGAGRTLMATPLELLTQLPLMLTKRY